jgi:hypothetical protein
MKSLKGDEILEEMRQKSTSNGQNWKALEMREEVWRE